MKREDIVAALRDLRDQADSHARAAEAAHQYIVETGWLDVRELLDRACAVIDWIGEQML